MKILLVSPEAPSTFWGFKNALRFVSKKAVLPPLGLLTVAAMLPSQWKKKLVDMTVKKLHDRDIRWADYVFVSAMHIQKECSRLVIDRCRKIGTKVVAGGPLFTAAPEEFDDVDHLVLNEAEITLPMFLEDLEAGHPKHLYSSNQWADINDSPIPLWELVDRKSYASIGVQYSRGCPHNCDFCDVTTLFGHRIRTKAGPRIIAELDRLYSTGWRGSVFVVDDNFIANKRKLKEIILPAVIDWMDKHGRPFYFNTQASIDLADDEELMRLMVAAGFDCVFVGIETPSPDGLAECNKAQNAGRDLIACVRKIQRFGMQVQGGFILGFDSDKPSAFDNLIQFIQNSGIVIAMVGLLNAPHGTKLYKRLKSEKRLLEYVSGDNTDCSMNFVPKMNFDDLVRGYQKVVRTIYSQKYYYARVRTFLKTYEPLARTNIRLTWCDFKAFLKSMWRMGIRDSGRIHYWKLIIWSLRRPKYLHLAVTLAIYGFHFRQIFDSYQSV